jgi:hypothetical protein
MAETNSPADDAPIGEFDETNGLAGNLEGDSDEVSDAQREEDEPFTLGSILRGATGDRGEGATTDGADGSDGEEPI